VNWAAAAVVLGLATSACAGPEPAAVVVSGTRSAGGAAEPTVLADLQLDSVTAAGALVDVTSVAAALGDAARTYTDADTFAFNGEAFDLAVGLTMGRALACCGEDADVEVGSAVLGIGDYIRASTRRVEHDGRRLAYGLSVGFVLAASFKKPWGMDWEERLAIFGETRAALAELQSVLPAAAANFDLSNAL
jgi:hypothetical protein